MSERVHRISQESFESMVLDVMKHMRDSKWVPDIIVGITRGGLIPATMLSHYFSKPLITLAVSLRDANSPPESNKWLAEQVAAGKKILLVDDINDTGATLQWIVNDWNASKQLNETVRVAVVVNNLSSEFSDVRYSAISCNKREQPVWIEFPYEGWWDHVKLVEQDRLLR